MIKGKFGHILQNKTVIAETSIAITFFFAFLIYFSPMPNNEVRLHDNFDGNFPSRHVLLNSGHFFDLNPNAKVPGIMNGLPRGAFPRFTDITSLLMCFLGSLPGYIAAFWLSRLLAFLGMFFIGRDHLNVNGRQYGILILISVAFACLPFFYCHGLTVAGIPFTLWAFINIYKRRALKTSYGILILFVFWSNLVLVGFHILFVLGMAAVILSVISKQLRIDLFLVLLFMSILYIISDYMLFYNHFINEAFVSSRSEFETELTLNFKGVIGVGITKFFTGDYSTANYFGFLFIPVYVVFGYQFKEHYNNSIYWYTLLFLSATISFGFMISLLDWKSMGWFYESVSFAKVFNFKRFTSLLPGFFFITSAMAMFLISRKRGFGHALSVISLLILFVLIWRGNINFNREGDTTGLELSKNKAASFNELYDPELFAEIRKEVGKDTTTNFIHFGITSIASKYARLPVLDDYQGDYPIEYKLKFRKIIEGELIKSEALSRYFDNWGSRCYLFSAKAFNNQLQTKAGMSYQDDLSINTQQLKAMNCKFIISRIIIGNAESLNIKVRKVFNGQYIPQLILYEIN